MGHLSDLIRSDVAWTGYETTVTKGGNDALLVTYHCKPYEEVRQWLFAGSKEIGSWWNQRCSLPLPRTVEEACRLCNLGKVRPTQEVVFMRDGRWHKIVSTAVGDVPKQFVDFMREVRRIDPDVEVVKVRM